MVRHTVDTDYPFSLPHAIAHDSITAMILQTAKKRLKVDKLLLHQQQRSVSTEKKEATFGYIASHVKAWDKYSYGPGIKISLFYSDRK